MSCHAAHSMLALYVTARHATLSAQVYKADTNFNVPRRVDGESN